MVNCQSRNKENKSNLSKSSTITSMLQIAMYILTMMQCVHCLRNKHNQTYYDLLTNNMHKYWSGILWRQYCLSLPGICICFFCKYNARNLVQNEPSQLTANKVTANQRFRYIDFIAVISSQSEGLGKMALGIVKIYLESPFSVNRHCSRSVVVDPYRIGMEVGKIVFHSVLEIFHSILVRYLPYSIPKFPFHFFIPCSG